MLAELSPLAEAEYGQVLWMKLVRSDTKSTSTALNW